MDLSRGRLKPFVPSPITSKESKRRSERTGYPIYHLFSGQKVTLFQGRTKGRIAEFPQGPTSFGWDPIFIPTEHDPKNSLSYAQMEIKVKNLISHRSKALSLLKSHFNFNQ